MIKLDLEKTQIEQAKKCMNNRELAKILGCYPGDLQKLYAGKRKATIKTIGKIAKALDVKVEDITFYEEV